MKVQHFYDTPLAHSSYAIVSKQEVCIIDPMRNPQVYYDFAERNHARIVAVIETHPHADFVSGHLEIAQTTGAVIYTSKLTGANYPHNTFDEGDTISLGDSMLKAMNTPGHSPDSICILLTDKDGVEQCVFTGDTLFVGDVGRPDLRETVGNYTAARRELAKAMFHSVHEKLSKLPDSVVVYPSHGPGSLCGKALGEELHSTIGNEKAQNYAFHITNESEFIDYLIDGQPFVPQYFTNSVQINRNGAPAYASLLERVARIAYDQVPSDDVLVIDTRMPDLFKQKHLNKAVNIPDSPTDRFETWLGTVIAPNEKYYLIVQDEQAVRSAVERVAKIAYDQGLVAVAIADATVGVSDKLLSKVQFNFNQDTYNILDVRSEQENKDQPLFGTCCNIPLPELRNRMQEIPLDKPLVVHCAAGYRSAIAAAILQREYPDLLIYDLSVAVKEYYPAEALAC